MIRNLKALGLALVAVFAFSAMVASTASAGVTTGKLTTDGASVTLTGEDTGPVGANNFTAFGNTVQCPNSTYTGHKLATTPHQFVPANATELTVTPHYKQVDAAGTANCDVTGGNSATIDMNGCDYVFRDFTTVVTASHPAHTYSFLADIVCPAGKTIIVRVFTSHSHGFEPCRLTIGAQTGLKGGTATHTTGVNPNGDIDLTGKITGISATKDNIFLCPGGEETTAAATYDLDVTVKGHNTLGETTKVTVTH